MSNIPSAREQLAAIAEDVERFGLADEAARIREVINLMVRRSPARRRAPVRSRVIETEDAAAIRVFAISHPSTSLQDVAVMFKTNIGRVSEAMQGDR